MLSIQDLENRKDKLATVFLVLLGLIIFTSLGASNGGFLSKIKVLSFVTELLQPFGSLLYFATFIVGVIMCVLNRGHLSKTLDQGKANEEVDEQKRKEEFPNKFPLINKIPVLRSLVRWGYKEGWGYSISLIILLAVGFMLRIWDLEGTWFYHDEIKQFQALQGLAHKGVLGVYNPFSDSIIEPYSRASLLTYTAFFLTKLFGNSILVIKLPVVLAGILLMPIFYLFSKKIINKPTAIIGLLLVTFNPYLIYLSRFFRNYSLLILFFSITVFYIAIIFKKFQEHGVHYKFIKKEMLLSISFFALTYHFGKIQALLLALIFVASFILLFHNFLWKFYQKNKKVSLSIASMGIIFFILDYMKILPLINISNIIQDHLNYDFFTSSNASKYLNYLFPLNFDQFFLGFSFIIFLFSIVKKQFHIVFLILVSFISYYAIAFLGERYEDFRYISFLIPIVLTVLAYVLYTLWTFSTAFQNDYSKSIFKILILSLILLTPFYQFPFESIHPPLRIHKAQIFWDENEGERYIHRRAVAPDYKKAFEFINANISDDDILIFHGREYMYLKNYNGHEIYSIPRKSSYVINLITGEDHPLNELLIQQEKSIWFVGAYVHLMDHTVIESFLSPPFENVGQNIGIKKYEYSEWHKGNNATWPTVVRRPSTSD